MKKAIIILGGNLKKDKGGRWRTTSFSEGDGFGALGDRLRVIAGEYLYKENKGRIIFALGGHGQLKNTGAPPISEAIKEELVERGIPESGIITETESGSTWRQLRKLGELIKSYKLTDVILISNKYHIPRIAEMIRRDDGLSNFQKEGIIITKSAESILINKEPKWKSKIKSVYCSENMKKRIALEEKGVRDIKEGKYKFY